MLLASSACKQARKHTCVRLQPIATYVYVSAGICHRWTVASPPAEATITSSRPLSCTVRSRLLTAP